MKLHEGTLYAISKRINDGRWLSLGSMPTREEAEKRIAENREFHLSRCPNDRVEYGITKVY